MRWYRIDRVIEDSRGRIQDVEPLIDGVMANSHEQAFEIAKLRNPLKQWEFIGTSRAVGRMQRDKAMQANQRRTAEIVEMYEIAERL